MNCCAVYSLRSRLFLTQSFGSSQSFLELLLLSTLAPNCLGAAPKPHRMVWFRKNHFLKNVEPAKQTYPHRRPNHRPRRVQQCGCSVWNDPFRPRKLFALNVNSNCSLLTLTKLEAMTNTAKTTVIFLLAAIVGIAIGAYLRIQGQNSLGLIVLTISEIAWLISVIRLFALIWKGQFSS